MPDTVKRVAIYNGLNWDKHDIGAKAENVTLSNINIGTNTQIAFENLIGSNTLSDRKIVITDNQQHIITSDIDSNLLNNLGNMIVTDSTSAPVTEETSEIKKLKQGNTIIYPTSKTSAIYMPDNTTLDGYLDNISDSIGNTDISEIGGGTITGALSSLNDIINNVGNVYFGQGTANIPIPQALPNNTTDPNVIRARTYPGKRVTLPPGTYIIIATGSFPTMSAVTTKRISIYNESASPRSGIVSNITTGSGTIQLQVIYIIATTVEQVYSCCVSCSSAIASPLACGTDIRAVRIK